MKKLIFGFGVFIAAHLHGADAAAQEKLKAAATVTPSVTLADAQKTAKTLVCQLHWLAQSFPQHSSEGIILFSAMHHAARTSFFLNSSKLQQ